MTIAGKNRRSDGRIFETETASEWKLLSNRAGFSLTPSYEGNNSGDKRTDTALKTPKIRAECDANFKM